ncbi:MAG: hypothetical protein KDC12_07160 [Flavobacteriales bacterium]|nr:hypothetical protein [Flavobacteriales bacterium]
MAGQVKVGVSRLAAIVLFGAIGLGFFFYLIETKFVPFRRKQILKKVIKVFDARVLSDSRAEFGVGGNTVIVDIHFALSLNTYSVQGEVISFHVPKDSVDSLELPKPLTRIEASLDHMPTYRIYQTNGMGLKLAKRRIDRCFAGNT